MITLQHEGTRKKEGMRAPAIGESSQYFANYFSISQDMPRHDMKVANPFLCSHTGF